MGSARLSADPSHPSTALSPSAGATADSELRTPSGVVVCGSCPLSSRNRASWLQPASGGLPPDSGLAGLVGGIGSRFGPRLGGLFLLGWVGNGIWCLLILGKNARVGPCPPLVTGQATAEHSFLWVMSLSLPWALARDPSSSCPPKSPATSAHSLRALCLPPSFLLWTELLPVPGTWWVLHPGGLINSAREEVSVALMLGLRS